MIARKKEGLPVTLLELNTSAGQKPEHQKTPPHFSPLPAQLSPNCAINKETKAATINTSQVLQKNVVLD